MAALFHSYKVVAETYSSVSFAVSISAPVS